MDGKTKDAIKQLQAELRQVQALLSERSGDGPAPGEATGPLRREKGGVVVQFWVAPAWESDSKADTVSLSATHVARVSNEAAAVLGEALSSPQKVALLRALLAGGAESAAALGAETQLSTGSLYHHLRDLMHAGLIAQSARNCYLLTERGRRVLLVVLALAAA